MKPRPFPLPFAALAFAALLATTGCISTRETVTLDAPRTKVAFASERAGRLFYETLARASRPREEKHTHVNLILVDVEQRTVVGPNRLFNEAVAFCDTNRDGEISEDEAGIFTSSWPPAKS